MNTGINAGFFLKGDASFERTESIFGTLAENGIKEFDYLTSVESADFRDIAARIRYIADKTETVIHQSHCPMGRYKPFLSYEDVLSVSLKAAEAAAVLGAKYFVVHADENRYDGGYAYNKTKIMKQMYEYVSALLEKASPYGMKICIENLFEDGKYPEMERSRFTSEIDELLGLVSRFDKDDVGICWDFGHALVAFGDTATDKFRLALPWISCTHVHDNNGRDEHRLPFRGKNDWITQMALLNESGYSGNLSFELVHGKIPDVLIPDYVRYCKKLGDYLAGIKR